MTLRVNRDEGAKELFGYEKEFADLHKLFEKIFCIPATSAPVERVFSTSELFMQPQCAACSQGQQLQVNWWS